VTPSRIGINTVSKSSDSRFLGKHVAEPEHVVRDKQPPGPQRRSRFVQHLRIAFLVDVVEHHVEAAAASPDDLQRVADHDLHAVPEATPSEKIRRLLGPLRGLFTGHYASFGPNGPREPVGAVAEARPQLDHPSGVDHLRQQIEQAPHLRPHDREGVALGQLLHLLEDGVVRTSQLVKVAIDAWIDDVHSGGSPAVQEKPGRRKTR
jgi:hypothetical protein